MMAGITLKTMRKMLARLSSLPVPLNTVSEFMVDDGFDLHLRLKQLHVHLVGGRGDFSLGLSGDPKASEWASVPYLFSFMEKDCDPASVDELTNSERQVDWFADKFQQVYNLLCDDKLTAERNRFFIFQHEAYSAWREKQIRDLQEEQ